MKNYKKIIIKTFVVLFMVFLLIFNLILTNENKILNTRLDTEEQYFVSNSNEKFIHISIDDTIDIFKDLTNNDYKSIFNNSTLNFLLNMHNRYGAKFSIYVFEEYDNFNLKNCTDYFKKEFENNSSWLKFGFHAYNNSENYNTIDTKKIVDEYNEVLKQLKRIVGEASITNVVRLEKFIINKENAKALENIENGIVGLLGADTIDRQDYYLDEEENNKLFKDDYYYDNENNIFLYNTDFRIENLNYYNIENELKEYEDDNNLIIFTHERFFTDGIKNKIAEKLKIIKICEYAIYTGYRFDFPMKK